MARTKRSPNDWEDKKWKKTRDKKRGSKASSLYKLLKKKQRKAKERDAMRHITDPEGAILPKFPKTDTWEWN